MSIKERRVRERERVLIYFTRYATAPQNRTRTGKICQRHCRPLHMRDVVQVRIL